MNITGIACIDQQRGLGRDGQLLAHLPSDMAWFQARTMGKPVVMGRATAQTLPRPLKERLNLVLSRTSPILHPDFVVCATWEEVWEHARRFYESCPSWGQESPLRQKAINKVQAWKAVAGLDFEHSLWLSQHKEIMIIGGGQIYTQATPYISRFEETRVHATFPADTFLSPWPSSWTSQEYDIFPFHPEEPQLSLHVYTSFPRPLMQLPAACAGVDMPMLGRDEG